MGTSGDDHGRPHRRAVSPSEHGRYYTRSRMSFRSAPLQVEGKNEIVFESSSSPPTADPETRDGPAGARSGESRTKPVNRELEALLAYVKERQAPKAGERFAVISWAIKVESYNNRPAALAALRRLPPARRLGVLDRKTGDTWAPSRAEHKVIKQAFECLVLKTLRFMGVT